MNFGNANVVSGDTPPLKRFPFLSSFHFEDFRIPGKLALVAESGAWAWVEPYFVKDINDRVVRLELLAESGTEAHGIASDVYNIIDAYHRFDLRFFKFEVNHCKKTMAKAEAALRRFLDGEHRPFSHTAGIPVAPSAKCLEDTNQCDPSETEIVDIVESFNNRLDPRAQSDRAA
jgi:hypothetical protein